MKKSAILLGVILAGVIIYNLVGTIVAALKSEERFAKSIDALSRLQIQNQELKKKLAQVKKPEFLEQQTRDQLGLSKPGETVVVIPAEKIDQVLGLNKKLEEARLPNWLGWWKVFFK